MDLRLTLKQDLATGFTHAILTRVAAREKPDIADSDSPALATDVCAPIDNEAFRALHLKPLSGYVSQPLSYEALTSVGRVLADCLLPATVRMAFRAELQNLHPGSRLRLRLMIASPPFATFPFEFAFLGDSSRGEDEGFLALYPGLDLVREVDDSRVTAMQWEEMRRKEQRSVDEKLRVLAASADPGTARYPHLPHIEAELASLVSVLETSPECRRTIQVESLRHATRAAFRRQVAETKPHILHFLGHADSGPTGAFLALLGEDSGAAVPMYVDEVARELAASPVRMIVLTACGTPASVHHLAETLIQVGGANTVIAMQLPLRDSMARPFSRALYSALAEGNAIEDCLWQARQAIQGAGPDFGVPVLYRSAGHMASAAYDLTALIRSAGVVVRDSTAPAEAAPSFVAAAASAELPPIPETERPFVGRRQAVEDILAKVGAPNQRLVTITGIGGMGKTTLALHCARLLREKFAGNVFFVSLDALDSRDEVVSALCSVLDIVPGSAATPEQALLHGIRRRVSRPSLLVIDCFERHMSHAGLIDSLLTASSHLSCLITSRIVLGLPKEFEYPLQPMATASLSAIPAKTRPGSRGARRLKSGGSANDFGQSDDDGFAEPELADSVTLFREAARHGLPHFEVEPSNREAVEALCRQLEGIPLALVLAAGRLRHLSLEDLLIQVSARPLKVLRRRRIGVESADRHSGLQEVIAGSFDLLEAGDRTALQQFGVFVGGFSVEAALAICDPGLDGDVIDSLGRLREHSLLQTDNREGRTRFRLLDTVREYLSGLGDAVGEGDGVTSANSAVARVLADCRERHANYYKTVAVTLYAAMRQTDWAASSAQLWLDLGNLRAATTYAIETRRDDLLITLADVLARLYAEAGLWSDFDSLTAAAQSAHERADEPGKLLRLMAFRAQMARRRGAETEGRILLERIREHCATQGDTEGEADALMELANQAGDLTDYSRAATLLEEAARLAREGSFPGLLSTALALQASVAFALGDRSLADTRAADALALLESSPNHDAEIFTCITVGRMWREAGDLEPANRVLLRALQVAHDGSRYFGVSRALLELGPLYEASGRADRAMRAYLAAERLHADLDARRRVEAAAALRRFRRKYIADPEVKRLVRAARLLPWNELAAQLLATPPASGES